MRTISIHHGEWEKIQLTYEHLKEKVSEHVSTLYREIKASAET